jgi:tRNA-splicing ligase RtcB
MPIVFHHVAVMPDVHLGKGAAIGTVIATRDAVIPAAVGVDIGCGMIAVRTTRTEEDLRRLDLREIRLAIERSVPATAGNNNREVSATAKPRVEKLRQLMPAAHGHYDRNWPLQLGSLGGGNHFIELCLDEESRVWATLHSGSRGVGNRIAQHHMRKARSLCAQMSIPLPQADLAYLVPGRGLEEYLADLAFAQTFAQLNRDEMMDRVMALLSRAFQGPSGVGEPLEVERINCHHNFTQREEHLGTSVWVTRKGAVRAGPGERAMIPGSMGTRSYIVSGKGDVQSFQSAPHGAGRRFSRGEARRRFTMQEFEASMAGIEHRSATNLLDEIPAAYKDIDTVMERSRNLVSIDHTLRQVLNVKGD